MKCTIPFVDLLTLTRYSDTTRACGGGTTFQLSDTVQINSPIVGQSYPANSDCTWTLNIPGIVHFSFFQNSGFANTHIFLGFKMND